MVYCNGKLIEKDIQTIEPYTNPAIELQNDDFGKAKKTEQVTYPALLSFKIIMMIMIIFIQLIKYMLKVTKLQS